MIITLIITITTILTTISTIITTIMMIITAMIFIIKGGVNFFDTADTYGQGTSELLLG
jgi:hypothetical protein